MRGFLGAVFTTLFCLLGPAALLAQEDLEVETLNLEALLNEDLASGESGSFGLRLDEKGIRPFLHGYMVFAGSQGFGAEEAPFSFDLHYFNIFVGAHIADFLVPEIQLEHEHGGEQILIRYAQLDITIVDEFLLLRVGKFLVPMGTFNEYLYPEYIAKATERAFMHREIIPVSWAEVGVQLRGKWSWSERTNLNYALFVVNGLEQNDGSATIAVEEGGLIRGMRNNYRDEHNGDKAVGGRLGIRAIPQLEVGLSGYTGAYTEDGAQRLAIGTLDLAFEVGGLVLHADYTVASQSLASGDSKLLQGASLQGSYKFPVSTSWLEPVLRVDAITLDQGDETDRLRATAGFNVYPDVDLPFVLKADYSLTLNQAAGLDAPSHGVMGQLGLGS